MKYIHFFVLLLCLSGYEQVCAQLLFSGTSTRENANDNKGAGVGASLSSLNQELKETESQIESFEVKIKEITDKYQSYSLIVERKLDRDKFPFHGGDIYQVRSTSDRRNTETPMLLVTTNTKFTSAGRASILAEIIAHTTVTIEDGFEKEIPVLKEIPESTLIKSNISQLRNSQDLLISKKQDIESKIESLIAEAKEKEAMKYAEDKIPQLLTFPSITLSNQLKVSGFVASANTEK